ncbi:hypothetical protein [Paenibacillus agricola]|uniref:Uncharacterized protein n=1 Tax=Paenibacillus agricola TaxID=2716264 RepID=A0ABX0JFS8_9BACL|nr:hypothetical protein [Paenibacillus agricola]NHN33553.1 hypothetical protein [Paenibacillus agricola]
MNTCGFCEKDINSSDTIMIIEDIEYHDECYTSHFCHYGNHFKDTDVRFIDCGDKGDVCSTCVGDSDSFGTPDHIREDEDFWDAYDPDDNN